MIILGHAACDESNSHVNKAIKLSAQSELIGLNVCARTLETISAVDSSDRGHTD
jgi:hypothetical protein